MFSNPVFKPHFSVHCQEPDTVVLLSETQELALKGEFYFQLAPFIDGRPLTEIVEAMVSEATSEEVHQAIEILHEAGFLQERSTLPEAEVAFWSALGYEADAVRKVFQDTEISLAALGIEVGSCFDDAFRQLGFQLGSQNPKLKLVLVDDYLNPALQSVNQEALAANSSWLMVRPGGRQPMLGPLLVPGKTGCWECMAQRIRFNRQLELMFKPQQTSQNQGYLDLTLTWVAQQTALEVARWVLDGHLPGLEGRIRCLDILGGAPQEHALVRRPQCPACGDPGLTIKTKIELEEVQLAVCDGGSYRARSAQQTWDQFAHHISPLTGVVTEVVPVRLTDSAPIFVYNSGNNLSRPRKKLDTKAGNFRQSSSGKGRTPLEAQVGALCEAIERYSFCQIGGEPVFRSSLIRLGDAGLHPNLCALYSQAQFDQRKEWNLTHKPMHRVPLPFDPEREYDWTPIWSLTREEVRYLPSAYCFYYYTSAHESDRKHTACISDSNGNAAGGNLSEAILQGLFELIERDGVALWWYNRLRAAAVDWESFESPYLHQLHHYYRSLGRDLWYLDLTTDLGWPVIAALSARSDNGGEVHFGFGCHSDPLVALTRAATEINQFLAMSLELVKQELPDDATEASHAELLWLRKVNRENNAWLAPDPGQPRRRREDFPVDPKMSGRERVLRCKDLLASKGLELLALDCTRPDVGLPCVKVVVPGLRMFWPRYAPGRLYDVPVELGKLARPTAEAELNPIALFW